MFWLIIGLVAVILTSIQFIPQVIKAFRTRKLRDISLTTFILIIFTAFSWILHGINRSDIAIISANFLILISASIIVILKIIYK